VVKLHVEEAAVLPEPAEGRTYKITKVEDVTTAVRGLKGLRVTLKDASTGEERATMIWLRDVAGPNSKLGAFIKAFKDYFSENGVGADYKDTDAWVGYRIRIDSWIPRARSIKVLGR